MLSGDTLVETFVLGAKLDIITDVLEFGRMGKEVLGNDVGIIGSVELVARLAIGPVVGLVAAIVMGLFAGVIVLEDDCDRS